MKKKVVDYLTNFIIRNKKCSEKDILVYRYGLEALYNQVTKTVVILIITIILKTYIEYFLLIVFYTFLRLFAFGIHANTSWGCWLTSGPIYIGGSYFIKYANYPKHIILIALTIFIIFAILWAPADTKKRPLIRKEQRKKLKIKSILVGIIYGILVFIVTNNKILNSICFSLVLESICICPLTYYITGNTFNNYITYNKEHGLN